MNFQVSNWALVISHLSVYFDERLENVLQLNLPFTQIILQTQVFNK